ncbi:MAG TPA: hypothetical protein VI873_00520 [Candidatus Peribacteraceae bacterium]|nr:hypothetical protein [Candidatus Peribacteraceae bacterium]
MDKQSFPVPAGYYDGVPEADIPDYQAVIATLEEEGVTDSVQTAARLLSILTKIGVRAGSSRGQLVRCIEAPRKLVDLLVDQIQANPDPVFRQDAMQVIQKARSDALQDLEQGVMYKIE